MHEPPQHTPPCSRPRELILAAIVAPLLAAALVAARACHIGVANEWTWDWALDPLWDRAWLPACFFLLLAAVLVAGQAYARKVRPRDEVALVGLAVALTFMLHLSVGYLGKAGGQEVVFATHTRWISGYFEAARGSEAKLWPTPDAPDDAAGLRPFLAGYADYIASLPMEGSMIHVGQHPPGCVLFYWIQLKVLEAGPRLRDTVLRAGDALTVGDASAFEELSGPALAQHEQAAVWSSYFVLAAAVASTAAFVYVLARRWSGLRAGLLAMGLCATTPSLHLFAPHVDQLHAPLAAGVCVLWAWGLRRGSWWRCGLAGVGIGVCLFVSLHFVALAALCVLAAAVWSRGREAGGWAWLAPCAWLGAGLAFVVALQYVCFSHNVLRVWWICLSKHETFYHHFPRTYWKWVGVNLVEFGLFAGAGAACLWVAESTAAIAQWRRGKPLHVSAALCLSGAAVLLLLNFSGKNLSEVARLWMFLMPLAAAAGGSALARCAGGRAPFWPWAVVAAQFVQVVVFKLRLDVFSIY